MSDNTYITVFNAKSFQEAHILAGFLESEGIQTRIPGAELVDEFGMATKLAGFAEVRVMEQDLATAQDIVAAWKERGADGKEAAHED